MFPKWGFNLSIGTLVSTFHDNHSRMFSYSCSFWLPGQWWVKVRFVEHGAEVNTSINIWVRTSGRSLVHGFPTSWMVWHYSPSRAQETTIAWYSIISIVRDWLTKRNILWTSAAGVNCLKTACFGFQRHSIQFLLMQTPTDVAYYRKLLQNCMTSWSKPI